MFALARRPLPVVAVFVLKRAVSAFFVVLAPALGYARRLPEEPIQPMTSLGRPQLFIAIPPDCRLTLDQNDTVLGGSDGFGALLDDLLDTLGDVVMPAVPTCRGIQAPAAAEMPLKGGTGDLCDREALTPSLVTQLRVLTQLRVQVVGEPNRSLSHRCSIPMSARSPTRS